MNNDKSVGDLIDSMTTRLDGTIYVDPVEHLKRAKMEIEIATLVVENNDLCRRNNDPVGSSKRALSRIITYIDAATATIITRNILIAQDRKDEQKRINADEKRNTGNNK